eukprot:GHVU01054206.1.p1 GENE.GHVU01054206.1~~GHVU01054206.1.p1  ORF type:complete len:384 (-),score=38.63 GHVU01054206.1:869-1903(-)
MLDSLRESDDSGDIVFFLGTETPLTSEVQEQNEGGAEVAASPYQLLRCDVEFITTLRSWSPRADQSSHDSSHGNSGPGCASQNNCGTAPAEAAESYAEGLQRALRCTCSNVVVVGFGGRESTPGNANTVSMLRTIVSRLSASSDVVELGGTGAARPPRRLLGSALFWHDIDAAAYYRLPALDAQAGSATGTLLNMEAIDPAHVMVYSSLYPRRPVPGAAQGSNASSSLSSVYFRIRASHRAVLSLPLEDVTALVGSSLSTGGGQIPQRTPPLTMSSRPVLVSASDVSEAIRDKLRRSVMDLRADLQDSPASLSAVNPATLCVVSAATAEGHGCDLRRTLLLPSY